MPDRVETVGLVGVGRMGRWMGHYLVESGWDLVAYDPDPEGVHTLVARGADAAHDVGEVARRSDLVLVVVVDDEQVHEVIDGPAGVFAEARDGTVTAISASISPETSRSLARRGVQHGVAVIDAALVGGERGAEEGRLYVLCGGDAAAIDAARPALSAFSRAVHRVGDSGAGMVAKIVNNLMLWACVRADYEAQLLGRALGVEPAALRAALAQEGSGANRPMAEWGEHRLRWPHKDLEQALAIADALDVEMPFFAGLPSLMEALTVEDLRALL